jgi:hypothetical protein
VTLPLPILLALRGLWANYARLDRLLASLTQTPKGDDP